MNYDVRHVQTTEFRGDTLVDHKSIGEKFVHHRYFNRQISRCEFIKCRFEDLRMWDSQISDTVFDTCDLRGAALGSIFEGRVNRFHRVTFMRTDLRRTGWSSAELLECRFIDTFNSRLTTAAIGTRASALLAYCVGGKGPLLRSVRQHGTFPLLRATFADSF